MWVQKLVCWLFSINIVTADLITGVDFLRDQSKEFIKLNNIKNDCFKKLNKYLEDLELKKKWAVQMSNSASKTPSGLYEGNLVDLGSFDQCLNIEERVNIDGHYDVIQGKYCLVQVPIANISTTYKGIYDYPFLLGVQNALQNYVVNNPKLMMSICVPDSCSAEDISDIVEQSPDFKELYVTVKDCQTRNQSYQFGCKRWIGLLFFIMMGSMIILSTGYDVYIHNYNKTTSKKILLAFSVYTNWSKLFSIRSEPDSLDCINGIRFLSTMQIILCHSMYIHVYSFNSNNSFQIEYIKDQASLFITTTSAVETFFFIGGLLLSHNFMKSNENELKFNIWKYYAHRYLRLTFPLLAIILFHNTFLRYLTSGPNWPKIYTFMENECGDNWWSALLYVQNYVNPRDLCIPQSWYLSVDMQLYWISPLLLVPLYKWPSFGRMCVITCIFLTTITCFAIIYIFHFNAFCSIAAFLNPSYVVMLYVNTVVRSISWLIGLLFGYFVYNRENYVQFNLLLRNKYIQFIGWTVSSILMAIALIPFYISEEYNRLEHAVYWPLHKIIWGLFMCWTIYTCILNQNGIVNKFLSHSYFQVLTRLSYCMFIIHMTLCFLKIGQQRNPIYLSYFELNNIFWGILLLSIGLSIFWTLAFEMPFLEIDKIIFGKGKYDEKYKMLNNNKECKNTSKFMKIS